MRDGISQYKGTKWRLDILGKFIGIFSTKEEAEKALLQYRRDCQTKQSGA